MAATLPEDLNICALHFGKAAGEWRWLGRMKSDIRGPKMMNHYKGSVVIAKPLEVQGEVHLTVTHSLLDLDCRVIAVDRDNHVQTSRRAKSVGAGGFQQVTLRFDLPLEQIKEFQFQTRPFEWVEFENVSLRPREKVDAQIDKVESTAIVPVIEARYTIQKSGTVPTISSEPKLPAVENAKRKIYLGISSLVAPEEDMLIFLQQMSGPKEGEYQIFKGQTTTHTKALSEGGLLAPRLVIPGNDWRLDLSHRTDAQAIKFKGGPRMGGGSLNSYPRWVGFDGIISSANTLRAIPYKKKLENGKLEDKTEKIGLKIEVLPKIIAGDLIEIEVSVESRILRGRVREEGIPDELGVPIIDRRAAHTTVRFRNNGTVVFPGLGEAKGLLDKTEPKD
jgi:hypothetical protein